MRRMYVWLAASVVMGVGGAWGDTPPTVALRDMSGLPLLGPEYPRVFFFRGAESAVHSAPSYDDWDAQFNRLMGIMGKCLNEEIVGHTARNPEYFNRFKERHPSQAVLLHFNGNSRDPRYETETYFPGHWIYRKAVMITADVPAVDGETDIQVDDVSDFKVNTGRHRTSTDDIALLGVTAKGTHDWDYCEQVRLISVNPQTQTIRVQRGCYGSKPLAFKAGTARAAAHAVEGPWGKNNNLLWFYNFASHCPRDKQGKTCADRLVDDLARWFGPHGILHRFDGLEFDVLHHVTQGDTDGDGRVDNGEIQGVNQYGIGVLAFARQLRARLGPEFILQADGALGPGGVRSQRAFGIFNGIESEGWPNLGDWEIQDWSGGLNRHFFWATHAHVPAFSYINHKWSEGIPGRPGETQSPKVPFARHRLVFAAAQFTDAMLCATFQPPGVTKQTVRIWDEFHGGADTRLGWLGRPEGPPIRLAARAPDLLTGRDWTQGLRGNVTLERQKDGWQVAASDPAAAVTDFTLVDVPAQGSNMVVFVTMRGQPRRGYPTTMARFAELEVSGGGISLLDQAPDHTSMTLREGGEQPIDPASGAHVTLRSGQDVGGQKMPAMFVHPPYKGGKGAVAWAREIDVPSNAVLRFYVGMGEMAPQKSDGVWFRVWAVALDAQNKAARPEKIFEVSSKENRWIPQSVDLRAWAGRLVRFTFEADCGPAHNAVADQASWGDVFIVPASAGAITRPERYMTWVGEDEFTASFYFRNIKSREVNLRFIVEGAEPISVRSIRAHAYPDVIARVFERGLVLANPSYEAFTFDLNTLAPGHTYRRLQATSGQDVTVNNGQPVEGGIVTLGARDGLFLMRTR